MTKADFISGFVFKGGVSDIDRYRFVKNKENHDRIIGHIEVRRSEDDRWKYYANVEKVNSVSASIYFFGIRKLQKERIIFKDLDKIGGNNG